MIAANWKNGPTAVTSETQLEISQSSAAQIHEQFWPIVEFDLQSLAQLLVRKYLSVIPLVVSLWREMWAGQQLVQFRSVTHD